MPNSFAPGDGRRVVVTGEGGSKNEASEVACLRAVASLISESPKDFVLRPKHWKVLPDQLLANLPGADAGHQALPVHYPARLLHAGEEAHTPDADARMVALLRECLDAHGGEFDPSLISHNKMGFKPEDERVYMVAAIRWVDHAFVAAGMGHDQAPDLERVKPDIFFVNEDGDK